MPMLERESHLQQLLAYARQAAEGNGQLVFVGGEMGIGKTTLVEALRIAVESRARMTIVSCDGLRAHGPLGPMVDLARTLGPEVEALLTGQTPRDHIFRSVETAIAQLPGLTILVGEDVHWGDEASLDFLYFLGRRIGKLRTLFVATYRDDEVPPGHPLRRVMGDLATTPTTRRMTLPPLSIDAITRLAGNQKIDPEELHAYTGGNPFYVREILDAGTAHPITIQDAIMARVSRISDDARATLAIAALTGMTVEPDLLQAVKGGPIDQAIDECLAVGLFRVVGQQVEFRHAAVRMAIVLTMSPLRSLNLHRRIFARLSANPNTRHDHARLAYHADEAGDHEGAHFHAMAAAREAVAYRSHREAAIQYARALRHAGNQAPACRADLLEACAYEWYLTGRLDDALAAQRAAVDIRTSLDDRLTLGGSLRMLSQYAWFAGDPAQAATYAHEALAMLEPFPQSREMALACSNLAQLRMLGHDLNEAVRWGERAIALAEALSDTPALVHALINVGTAKCLYRNENDPSGYELLDRAVELARRKNLEDEAAQAYSNLIWISWDERRLDQTRSYLDAGLAFTAEHDLPVMHLCMEARQSSLKLARFEWAPARLDAEMVARHERAKEASRIVALETLGLAHARQGAPVPAGEALDEALELANQLDELQWTGRIRVARAEAAWLAGDDRTAIAEASAAISSACDHGESWIAGQLALWRHRAGHPAPVPAGCSIATPYRLEIAGDWQEAARFWHERGLLLEEARALANATDEATLRQALSIFDQAGAWSDAARVASRLRKLGFRNVRRGPHQATRSGFAMLTPRETEVLSLMAGNATNRMIAQQLYLSQRTIEHHVSAILAKLDVPTRAAAIDRARAAGVIAP